MILWLYHLVGFIPPMIGSKTKSNRALLNFSRARRYKALEKAFNGGGQFVRMLRVDHVFYFLHTTQRMIER
ncbi:MAG: hypothetical protein ACJAUP_001350 [Cellvibrionaceae bacterium]|jgi:hypothetical protein